RGAPLPHSALTPMWLIDPQPDHGRERPIERQTEASHTPPQDGMAGAEAPISQREKRHFALKTCEKHVKQRAKRDKYK
ncbi:MAG: hypothetical protein ACOCOO_07290, partial [Prevotella sp.]